jgi:hypothetical protein
MYYAGQEPALAASLRDVAARWYARMPKMPEHPNPSPMRRSICARSTRKAPRPHVGASALTDRVPFDTVRAMTSLIQKRMALNRWRVRATVYVVVGVLFGVFATVSLIGDPSRWWTWLQLAFAIAVVAIGVVEAPRHRAAAREFESEHGIEAGQQD